MLYSGTASFVFSKEKAKTDVPAFVYRFCLCQRIHKHCFHNDLTVMYYDEIPIRFNWIYPYLVPSIFIILISKHGQYLFL